MKTIEQKVAMYADEARIYARDVMVVASEDVVRLVRESEVLNAKLLTALKEQVVGATWRRENEPANWNGADDEALERSEVAIADAESRAMSDPTFMNKEELEAENARLRALNTELLEALKKATQELRRFWETPLALRLECEAVIAKTEGME